MAVGRQSIIKYNFENKNTIHFAIAKSVVQLFYKKRAPAHKAGANKEKGATNRGRADRFEDQILRAACPPLFVERVQAPYLRHAMKG